MAQGLEKHIATDFRLTFDNPSGARALKTLMVSLNLFQPVRIDAKLAEQHDTALMIIQFIIGGEQYTGDLIDQFVDAVLALARINQAKEKENG